MTRGSGMFAALWLVLSCSQTALADDYWVAMDGMDAAGRGAESAPFETLQYAADLVQPGDTVHVRDGAYVGAYIERDGAPGMPITFIGEGDAVRITAPNSETPDGINVEGGDYVTIDNFIVDDMERAGVRCALSEHVTIRRIRADGNGSWGILTGCCEDLLIENNITTNSVAEHGIYVGNSADRPVIRNNISHGNRANGIHMNADASITCDDEDFESDGIISGAIVENNVIYDNGVGGGSGINCDGVQDSIIQNNLIYDAHSSGISLYQIDAAEPASGNRILHNTVIQADDGRWALNIQGGSTGTFVRNNIFVTEHAFRGSINVSADSLEGLDSDYNLVTPRLSPDGDATILSLEDWQALGYDAHSLSAEIDAIFVNPAVANYHLADGSPALDKGQADIVATDLEGGARPVGSAPDLGAYERGSMPMVMDAGVDASTNDASAIDSAVEAGPTIGAEGAGDEGPMPSVDDDGCGCRMVRRRPSVGAAWFALGLLGLVIRRRR